MTTLCSLEDHSNRVLRKVIVINCVLVFTKFLLLSQNLTLRDYSYTMFYTIFLMILLFLLTCSFFLLVTLTMKTHCNVLALSPPLPLSCVKSQLNLDLPFRNPLKWIISYRHVCCSQNESNYSNTSFSLLCWLLSLHTYDLNYCTVY